MTESARERGKRPATRLAGPYGHPFHPMIVPVPIGAWVASVVLDVASRLVAEGQGLAQASVWLLGIGVVSAIVAATFGLLDLAAIPRGTHAFRIAVVHLGANLTATGLFAVGLFVRLPRAGEEIARPGDVVVSVVALALVAAGGWLGGDLTYRFGVRVADEETQARGFD